MAGRAASRHACTWDKRTGHRYRARGAARRRAAFQRCDDPVGVSRGGPLRPGQPAFAGGVARFSNNRTRPSKATARRRPSFTPPFGPSRGRPSGKAQPSPAPSTSAEMCRRSAVSTKRSKRFFDLCKARGPTGTARRAHSSRKRTEPHAEGGCRRGSQGEEISVYAVSTIDEGVALLTGVSAGERQADGSYPAASLNGRVQARLKTFADRARYFNGAPGKSGS